MLSTAKDAFAVIKEIFILGVIGVFLVNPEVIGQQLARAGFTKLSFGGAEVQLDQFRQTRNALVSVERAQAALADAPASAPAVQEVRTQLDQEAQNLRTIVAETAARVAAVDPAAVPQSGWMLLGTLQAETDTWKPDSGYWRTTRTTDLPFRELTPGKTFRTRTAVNLRDSVPNSSTDRLGTVVTALQSGQQVRVVEVPPPFQLAPGAPDSPGRRVWARVEVVSASGRR